MSSQALAVLLSSGCGYLLTTYLAPATLTHWGWRVPFLLGALVGPLGFYIRHHIAEPPEFEALRKQVQKGAARTFRLRDFVREQGDAALCAMGVMIIGTASNYLWNAYLPVYVERQLHLPLKSALLGTFAGGVINFLLFPLSGKLADRFGAYRLFYPLVISWLLCTFPLFWYIVSAPSLTRLFVAQIVASIFQVAIAGSHPGMLATLFPAKTRSTGVALSYNLAVTLFGGLAPLTVATLTEVTGSHYVPAFYVAFAALVSLGLVTLTRTGQAALATDRSEKQGFFRRTRAAPMVESAPSATTKR
jgi:MHS family proline/betaine transporter-like MFS transporter